MCCPAAARVTASLPPLRGTDRKGGKARSAFCRKRNPIACGDPPLPGPAPRGGRGFRGEGLCSEALAKEGHRPSSLRPERMSCSTVAPSPSAREAVATAP